MGSQYKMVLILLAVQREIRGVTMGNFFKRTDAATATAAATPTSNEPLLNAGERRRFPRPLPVPEVVEGNEDSDWSLWEESVSFQDSQMQPVGPTTKPMPLQAVTPGIDSEVIDPFATVHKNSG